MSLDSWSACAVLAVSSLLLVVGTARAESPPPEDELEIEPTADPVDPRVVALEARVQALEAERAAAAAAAAQREAEEALARAAADEAARAQFEAAEAARRDAHHPKWWASPLELDIGGWIQTQYMTSQLSTDELSADGVSLNQDRFLVRRGRIELDLTSTYVEAGFEIDANTTYGPAVGVRGVDISAVLPHGGTVPYAKLTAGYFDIPFGFALPEDADDRYFMERALGSRAMFPGDSDVGVMLSGGLGPVRYALSADNGTPLREDPSADNTIYVGKPTWLGRVGFEVSSGRVLATGGVSYLNGTGFHAGTPATKASLLWSDENQDGTVTLNELEGVNAQAATESGTFDRWGVGADVEVALRTELGWTRLDAEVIMGANLDRAYYVADPISVGYDLRESMWLVAITQELAHYGIAGVRIDAYQPNADDVDSRRGLFIPNDAGVSTISPIAGVQIPDRARFLVQYDYVADHLGRDVRGEPTDLKNDLWTVRAQVSF
jgi:hypothetical protein